VQHRQPAPGDKPAHDPPGVPRPDAISTASEKCDDPLRIQRVRWQRTASLMSVGAFHQAQVLMTQVRHDLGEDLASMDGPTLSVYGSSHLRSAILAARASRTTGPGSAQDAWTHIEAAREIANRIGGTATTTAWHSARPTSLSMKSQSISSSTASGNGLASAA
jgi:hypothetical protein